jgi:two-component system NtrC family response regulator
VLESAFTLEDVVNASIHVLVVDDEATFRGSLMRVLEARGMQVGAAADGAQALEYVVRTPPDVALVGVGGLELLAQLRATGAAPEVILVTALADVDSAVAAMRAGAYHFLTKPLHSNEAVAHLVARAAEHRRLADRASQLLGQPSPATPDTDEGGHSLADPTHAVLADLARQPYADAKRRLVALFDDTYTTELLRRTNGNMSEAARRAGLDRSNFRRLLKRHRAG